MQQLRDQSGPAGLVRRTDAAAGITVEIFIEEKVIAEMRVTLDLVVRSEHGPATIGAEEKYL